MEAVDSWIRRVEDLQEKLRRAERERGEYQEQCHVMAERAAMMTSAAASAAGTAEAALRRLMRAELLVEAALALAADPTLETGHAFAFAVETYMRGLPS